EQEISDVSRIGALPLSHLSGCFVFLRAANKRWTQRRQLLEDLLLENRADVGTGSKVRLSARVAALTAHVNQIGERLSSRCSLVKVSALPAEGIRRDYALRLELVVTHGTTKLYRTQRCHGYSSYPFPAPLREKDRE